MYDDHVHYWQAFAASRQDKIEWRVGCEQGGYTHFYVRPWPRDGRPATYSTQTTARSAAHTLNLRERKNTMAKTLNAAPDSDQAVAALRAKLTELSVPDIPDGTVVRAQFNGYTYVALWVGLRWYHTGRLPSGPLADRMLTMQEFLDRIKSADSIEVADSWNLVV